MTFKTKTRATRKKKRDLPMPQKSRFIGVDQSLSCTGVVVCDLQCRIKMATCIPTSPKGLPEERLDWIGMCFDRILAVHGEHLKFVAIEKFGTQRWVGGNITEMSAAMFIDLYRNLRKEGKSHDAARLLAGDRANVMMGLMPSSTYNKTTGAVMSALMMARSYTTAQFKILTGMMQDIPGLSNMINLLPKWLRPGSSEMTWKIRNQEANFYRARMTKSFILYYGVLTALQLAITGGEPPWKNEKGHKFDLKLPWKKNGKDMYIDLPLGRQMLQLIRMVEVIGSLLVGDTGQKRTALSRYAISKSDPFLAMAFQLFFDADPWSKTGTVTREGASRLENKGLQAEFVLQKLMPSTSMAGARGQYQTGAELLAPVLTGSRVSVGKEFDKMFPQQAELNRAARAKAEWDREILQKKLSKYGSLKDVPRDLLLEAYATSPGLIEDMTIGGLMLKGRKQTLSNTKKFGNIKEFFKK